MQKGSWFGWVGAYAKFLLVTAETVEYIKTKKELLKLLQFLRGYFRFDFGFQFIHQVWIVK